MHCGRQKVRQALVLNEPVSIKTYSLHIFTTGCDLTAPCKWPAYRPWCSALRTGLRVPADLIVVDECHRALSEIYKEVLDCYPAAQVLGLTATPCRLDNQGLGEVFEEIVVAANTKDLVSDGYLVEPTV